MEGQLNLEQEIQWKTSGPFSIEKDEYYLGKKMFLQVNQIPIDVSEEIIFLRPSLDESKKIKGMEEIPAELIYKKAKHLGIKFNGKNKQSFNLYFEPK